MHMMIAGVASNGSLQTLGGWNAKEERASDSAEERDERGR